jgi:hypothetical protein
VLAGWVLGAAVGAVFFYQALSASRHATIEAATADGSQLPGSAEAAQLAGATERVAAGPASAPDAPKTSRLPSLGTGQRGTTELSKLSTSMDAHAHDHEAVAAREAAPGHMVAATARQEDDIFVTPLDGNGYGSDRAALA